MYYYIESSLIGLYSVWLYQTFTSPFILFWIGCSREFILYIIDTTTVLNWNSITDGCLFMFIMYLIEIKIQYKDGDKIKFYNINDFKLSKSLKE